MRRHPAVTGSLIAVVALAAAVGAGAGLNASLPDDSKPEPEVSLSFNQSDDESDADDLIGGEVTGKSAPSTRFASLDGGDAMSLADLEGRPVVVNFFATWCTPCVKEMPAFESVHRELADAVEFVGIDVRDSASATRELVDRTGVTYQIGRDPSGELFTSFGALNMPSTFLIDASGRIVDQHAGALSADELRAAIRRHLLT